MIDLFQGLVIVFVYLLGEKMIPAACVFSPLPLEIGTDEACGEFLKEVLV
jgi:hypothetical protein